MPKLGEREVPRNALEPISYRRAGDHGDNAPTIDLMDQRDGSQKWKVSRGGASLNKLGEWEYEPMPSSRTDDYLERCRYDSLNEAFDALIKALP